MCGHARHMCVKEQTERANRGRESVKGGDSGRLRGRTGFSCVMGFVEKELRQRRGT